MAEYPFSKVVLIPACDENALSWSKASMSMVRSLLVGMGRMNLEVSQFRGEISDTVGQVVDLVDNLCRSALYHGAIGSGWCYW